MKVPVSFFSISAKAAVLTVVCLKKVLIFMRTSSIFFAYSILTGILEAARFNWWARQWMPIIQGNSNFMRVIKPDLFPIIDAAPSVAMAAIF